MFFIYNALVSVHFYVESDAFNIKTLNPLKFKTLFKFLIIFAFQL